MDSGARTAVLILTLMSVIWVVLLSVKINQVENKIDKLDKVHRIFEDNSVCHLDPDGPDYCAR